jgi:hypothetical protein
MFNKRWIGPAGFVILSLLGLSISDGHHADAAPVRRSADFINSIGVNAHVEYTDSRYANLGGVIRALRFAGLTHVRDSAPWHGNQGQSGYGALGDLGVVWELFLNRKLPDQVNELSNLVRRHPKSADMIEGPNEVNNAHMSYEGITGTAGAQAYQSALYNEVKSHPALHELPVLNFTDYPDASGKADFANFHSYPKRGAQPAPTLTHDRQSQQHVMPGVPILCTEAGYYTVTGGTRRDGVTEDIQAAMIANLLLDNFVGGVDRTYLYELLDAYPDPSGTNGEKHYGLFHVDYSPKPSALFLHNLHQVLGQDDRASFKPVDLTVRADDAKSLLLQRSDGRYFLILWREPRIWVADAQTTPAHVRLDGPRNVSSYSPLTSAASNSLGRAQDFEVPLGIGPVILAF